MTTTETRVLTIECGDNADDHAILNRACERLNIRRESVVDFWRSMVSDGRCTAEITF